MTLEKIQVESKKHKVGPGRKSQPYTDEQKIFAKDFAEKALTDGIPRSVAIRRIGISATGLNKWMSPEKMHGNERIHARFAEMTREQAKLKGQDGNRQLELEIHKLQSQMSKLQKRMFGSTSERRGKNSDESSDSDKKDTQPQTGHGPREQRELDSIDSVYDLCEEEKILLQMGRNSRYDGRTVCGRTRSAQSVVAAGMRTGKSTQVARQIKE